jgi:NAD(P)-dependent dehydrogenase (short-subunit alcohol dehydrogenase family)
LTRVAIVTSAGHEAGEASALRFAEAGWQVACVDVDEAGVRQTAQLIEARGGRAIAVVADVSTADGSRRMVDDTVQAFGGLAAMHTNTPLRVTPAADELTLADWDRLHAVTLRSAYLAVRQAIPELRRSGGGAIVMTAGSAGAARDLHLATMNGGLRSLCRSVATGYGKDNIRINTISPGPVSAELAERPPLGRLATARDLANVAVFLASPEASYVTGTDVVMDGGWRALVS